MKKFVCLLLLLAFCLPVAACTDNAGTGGNGGGGGEEGEATKIVIYTGGSSEYAVVKGSDEDRVIEAVEQAYYEDTGILLDFDVNYLGSTMLSSLAITVAGGTQVDIAVSHAKGGSGIDDFVIENEMYYDLADLIAEYGTYISQYSESAMSNVTTYEGNVIGFPSVMNPYKYGILVRKDYMEQAGYTDDPAKTSEVCSETGENYVLVDNLEDFTEMCKKIKEITGYSYAVTGAIWDLEKALVTGAYADGGYFNFVAQKDSSGNITAILPGFATEEYGDILALEYEWATEGIISKDANNITLDMAEQEFIAGNTGVFMTDPSIDHLISVARRTEAYAETQGETAEFTVLPPLTATRESTRKGFIRNSEATFIASVLSTSRNAEAIVRFVNWMYMDEENYRLCKFGIEGEHYVDNGDGTYSYPEGKDEYFVEPPYSGVLALVENQNVCDLEYDGYTDEEREWLEIARDPDNYVDNDVVDYLMPSNEEMNAIAEREQNTFYMGAAIPAWNGSTDPRKEVTGSTGKMSNFELHRQDYLDGADAYIKWVTNMYALLTARYE